MTRPIRLPAGMTTPRKTPTGWDSSVTIPQDEDGFFGRECPAKDCLAYFKLHGDEYQAARKVGLLSCPICGVRQDDQTFLTPEQVKRTHAAMMELAHGAVEDAFATAFGGLSRSNRQGGVTIQYTPGPLRVPRPLPTYIERQTIRTFTCPNGGHRAVIYDLLTVCPYCGPDTPPRAVLDDNLAGMSRVLAVVEELPEEHRREIEAAGGVTSLAERALSGAVAAAQNFAKQLRTQKIVAVKQANTGGTAEAINFVSSLSNFTVGVAATANGDGLNSGLATYRTSAANGSGANMSIDTAAGAMANTPAAITAPHCVE